MYNYTIFEKCYAKIQTNNETIYNYFFQAKIKKLEFKKYCVVELTHEN